MRVLVTGDRAWEPAYTRSGRNEFDHLISHMPKGSVLIVGDCPTGADKLALEAAVRAIVNGSDLTIDGPHKADWDQFHRAAGPIRNRAMLDRYPDLVVAFHADLSKSKGTADCVKQAEKRGLTVFQVKDPHSWKTITRAWCDKCGSRSLAWIPWGSYLDKDLNCRDCGHTVDVWDC